METSSIALNLPRGAAETLPVPEDLAVFGISSDARMIINVAGYLPVLSTIIAIARVIFRGIQYYDHKITQGSMIRTVIRASFELLGIGSFTLLPFDLIVSKIRSVKADTQALATERAIEREYRAAGPDLMAGTLDTEDNTEAPPQHKQHRLDEATKRAYERRNQALRLCKERYRTGQELNIPPEYANVRAFKELQADRDRQRMLIALSVAKMHTSFSGMRPAIPEEFENLSEFIALRTQSDEQQQALETYKKTASSDLSAPTPPPPKQYEHLRTFQWAYMDAQLLRSQHRSGDVD